MRRLSFSLALALTALCLTCGPSRVLAQYVATPATGLGSAVRATDGTEGPVVLDVRDYGAIPGDALDDAPAINTAILEACAVPADDRPAVRIPEGVYKIGSGIANQFYSTVNIPCSPLTLAGDGSARTILEPTVPTGSTILFVCGGYDSHGDVAACTTLDDVAVEDLKLRDDDPYAHGHGTTIATITTCTDCIANVPDFEDSLTWAGGTGTLHEYVSGDGLISLHVDSGTLETDDVVTDGNYSFSGLSGIEAPTSEESHGLTVFEATVQVRRVTFSHIADEGVDAKAGAIVLITDSFFDEVSQAGAGGSAVAVAANATVSLSNSVVIPGDAEAGAGGAAGLAVEGLLLGGTRDDSPHLVVSNVTIIENGASAVERVEALVAVSSSQHEVFGIGIASSFLEVRSSHADTAVLETSGSNPIDVALTGNTIVGGKIVANLADEHEISLLGGSYDCYNDTGSCISGMQTMQGVLFRSLGTADPAIVLSNDGALFVANAIETQQTCMFVTNGNGVTVTGNVFSCGLNTVGLDYAIRFTGTNADVYVAENYFEFVDGGGTAIMRSSLPASAVNQNNGDNTTTGVIDATSNRGDITP